MQEVGTFVFKTELKKYLKKDPRQLFAIIETHLGSGDSLADAKKHLEQIIEHNSAESNKDILRKKLSRQIGLAKKQKEDCKALIDQVSDLSAEIKTLKEQRENATNALDLLLAKASIAPEPPAGTPRHFNDALGSVPEGGSDQSTWQVTELNDDPQWQRFVDNAEQAHLYHDSRWFPLIERNFGQKTYRLGCFNEKKSLTGVMAVTHLKSKLFGLFTISTPYFNYGGPLATDSHTSRILMEQAAKITRDAGCSHMEVRETSPRDGWLCSGKKVSMILNLPDSDEALDKQLGSKLRAQVKRAAGHQLTVTTGKHELVDAFYSVYSHNMRDLGTPAYSVRFFRDIVETFPQESFITVVQQGRKTLAAGLMLGYRDKLEIPWASSLRKYNHLGANMLMYRSVLSEAIDRGYEFFDFGRSTRDANTYRFKKQWGATEYPLYWHYWTKNNQLPEINPDNPKYKLVIAAWQKLPVPVTRVIGPYISRNLP
jgi:FemAB-related protein (PEP-CTERM system-associated)